MSLGSCSRGVTQFDCTGGHWPCARMHQQKTSAGPSTPKKVISPNSAPHYLIQDFFSPSTEYVNIHRLVPVQLSLTGRVQLGHLFSAFQVVSRGIFLQEKGNQVLGNYKLIVFPSKRQREEQAKPPPVSGAAFTAAHAQSSGRSNTPGPGLGVFTKPIPKYTS